jgi:hypothetical protein
MPWGERLVWLAVVFLTAGLGLPLWLSAERKYRKEHTLTVYE